MVLHLSHALEGKLTACAMRRGVSIEALAHEMLERALDYDDWFIGEVEVGLAQAEIDETLTHEAVGARLPTKLAEYASIRW
jgi:predicted transcriptional regulator